MFGVRTASSAGYDILDHTVHSSPLKNRRMDENPLVMTPMDLEAIAERMYRRAGFPTNQPAAPLHLAGKLLGWDALRESRAPRSPVVLDGQHLVLRPGVSAGRRSWHVARALAQWAMQRLKLDPSELAIDSLAACLRTPRQAFAPIALATGPAFSDLAEAFRISESAAALRFAEVTRTPLVLRTPVSVRMRGGPRPVKARPRRITLHDYPGRVVDVFV
jgi:hypothetical protein